MTALLISQNGPGNLSAGGALGKLPRDLTEPIGHDGIRGHLPIQELNRFHASSTPCFSLVRNFSNASFGLSACSLKTVMPHLLRTASSTGLGLIMKTKD